MSRAATIAVLAIFLAGCGMSAEGRAMKKRYLEACLQGSQGACDVLAADAAAQGYGRAAAMQNWTAATNNTANWAVQQQLVPTYSGGYRNRYTYPRY